MSSTQEFIQLLLGLKGGEISLLRRLAFAPLDKSVTAFDLFTGLWWPIRAKTPRAPRREAAWLVLKLYGFRPIKHTPGKTFSMLLARWRAEDPEKREPRADFIMNRIITSPLDGLELPMRMAFARFSESDSIDWVALTDDLSFWEKQEIRTKWISDFFKDRR